MRHYVADVRDVDQVRLCLNASRPDVILHLAAQSVVREGYRSPLETFSVNVMGTAALLEAVRREQRPCVVLVVSSDKCYENHEQPWGEGNWRDTSGLPHVREAHTLRLCIDKVMSQLHWSPRWRHNKRWK